MRFRAECIAAMGAELGELFSLLSDELARVQGRWHEYLFLFCGPQQRLDLMNAAAPFFFSVVQRSLWSETQLGISRLVGAASTGATANPSVRRTVALIRDTALRKGVSVLVSDAVDRSAAQVEPLWRPIAPRDHDVELATDQTPPGSGSHEQITAALAALARLLNTVQRHFLGSTTAYDFSSSPYGAERLLCVVRDGLRREGTRPGEPQTRQREPDEQDEHGSAVGGTSFDPPTPRLHILR